MYNVPFSTQQCQAISLTFNKFSLSHYDTELSSPIIEFFTWRTPSFWGGHCSDSARSTQLNSLKPPQFGIVETNVLAKNVMAISSRKLLWVPMVFLHLFSPLKLHTHATLYWNDNTYISLQRALLGEYM